MNVQKLSEESTKEEVGYYFWKKFKITEENKNKMINEDISGDVLLDITDNDFKSFGIKVGPLKKARKYLDENKNNFKDKEIKEVITAISNPEEVKNFFVRCLNFNGELNNLNGQQLIELDEEAMKQLGLNLGQRKKLIKYIEYFKTIKSEISPTEEEEIKITKKSSEEEVAKFLKMRLKFSQESIESLGLDGESLHLLEETEIDGFTDLTQEERDNLKRYLSGSKNEEEPITTTNIKITDKSTTEEVSKFLKDILGFKDESIEALGLDGESLFLLTDTEIDELTEIGEEEREKLKKFLSENKSGNENKKNGDSKKDNKNGQDKKDEAPNTKNQIIEDENKKEGDRESQPKKDGDTKSQPKNDEHKNEQTKNEIQKDENKKDGNSNKEYKSTENPKDSRIKITKETSDKDIIKFLKEKLNCNEENYYLIKELDIEKIPELTEKEKDILKQFIKKEKEKKEKTNEENRNKNNNLPDAAPPISSENRAGYSGNSINEENGHKNIQNNMPNNNRQDRPKIIDPLLKKVDEIRVEKEIKSDKKKFYPFKKCKIEKINIKSKYNIFFLLNIQEKYIKNLSLSTFYDDSGIIYSSFINFDFIILNERKYTPSKGEPFKCFIIQVPLNTAIKRLSISLIKDKTKTEYNSYIDIRNDNFFYINNLLYDKNNDFIDNNADTIFNNFLCYFLDKDKKIPEIYQKKLIESLLNILIYNNRLELKAGNILMLLKSSIKFNIELKNIDSIEVYEEAKNKRSPLNHEYCLLSEDIDKINSKREKSKIIDLIIYIYANYDKDYLKKLIDSKNGKDYMRAIFDLIINKILKLSDLSFKNDEELKLFQKNLLLVSKSKEEINFTIKLFKGLTNSLQFILENIDIINSILDKKGGGFFGLDNNNYLTLENLTNEDNDIHKIYGLLSNIIKLSSNKYNLINLEEIFEKMVDYYSNKSLNEFCKLDIIAGLLKNQKIMTKKFDIFYNKIHQKGMNLIKNKKLTTKEIINFITSQDIYYYNPIFKNNNNRDPKIFNYIPITDIDKNYLDNIKQIKDFRLWEIFSESNYKTQSYFKSVIIEQMNKIRDFNSIFEIFPLEYFDKDFTFLINGKIQKLIYTVLDENEKNFELIFNIFDNWLICNNNNNLDFNFVINLIEINYDLTSKYYFHVLKSQKMKVVAMKIRNFIINFFIVQNKEGKSNAESLISLLLLSPNSDFCLYFLNQLNNKILTEEEFYQKEETENFLLLKLFFQKCNELINNKDISDGRYLRESLSIRNKISNNLFNSRVKYDVINNLIDDNIFYQKIVVILDKDSAKNIYNKLKENFQICQKKFEELEIIEDYYTTFFSYSKREIILLIKQKLEEFKQKNICDIINCDNFFNDNNEFNLAQAIEESKNIKYKSSCFFMAIYISKRNGNYESEEELFNDSKQNYIDTLQRIIKQKESKEPFFGINNVKEIMKVIRNANNDMKKEIEFIEKEFADLGKQDYIKNNLLNDLINFSKKDKVVKLLDGIIKFIETYDKIKNIQKTDFINQFKETYKTVNLNGVSGEEIKNAIDLLKKYDYDVDHKTTIIKFYELLLGKEESILFIKKIKDSDLDIRNLNEFIDENENSQLQTTDVDNLMDVYKFFINLMNNEEIKTDETLLKIFRKEFDKNKDIVIKLQGYLNTYGEIIQLYQSYHENPEMTIQKIDSILKESSVKLYKEQQLNLFTFSINYINQNNQNVEAKINELEELRNKILMSSTNTNVLKNEEEDEQNKRISKEKITKEFVTLIDNIKQLNDTLNSLLKSGYPKINNLSLIVKNSHAYDKNNSKKNLETIIEEYKEINKNYKKSIKNGYREFPFLRLFYGPQFIQLYEISRNNDIDISHLINSVSLNKIKDTKIKYDYNNGLNEIQNINQYLEKLFYNNNVNLNEIYQNNILMIDSNLSPGLYRKIKYGDNCDLINNILNIYLNLTNNIPIIDTLLICNEETTIEKIRSFLYRAIFCDKPVLFVIANMECLELSTTQSLIKTLKMLYKIKNRIINSCLLFIYEKVDSGLVRDIEKIIPEKNILDDIWMKKPDKKYEIFQKIDLYSSKFSGFGKTTEIIYKVKNKGGIYRYLPIGGTFTRNYVINNLINLNLDLKNGKDIYLHLDLSDTDNEDLMNEILFNITILRYIDSNEKIFYLGNDINLIIEIPKSYVEFDKKYKLLNLFNKIYIDKLYPLRLEENAQYIRNSPISIVAEVLSLFDNNEIDKKNIDLDMPIQKSAEECEKIINKYFKVPNQNYYQKMNFIKILSIQFKKFTENIYFNYELSRQLGKDNIIKKARLLVIRNFIELTKVFTRSPFDTILLKQTKSVEMFGKYDENQAKEEEIMDLADKDKKEEIFSFEQIKPSLVFFNRDGNSLSIISNNDKKAKEYNDLKLLWNSQNPDPNKMEELIDYKNMQHEAFLDQIKRLFSLDKMSIEDIKKLCEDLGNYIFVSDNFIKMVRILLNIEAKIPVILMGETGVGKTKLLEMLTTLYGKGKCRWKRLQIHAGTTDKKIVKFIEKITEEVNNEGAQNELTWVFLDEINTCNSLGLITEIMCNHTYLGKKINDNFVFLGACNPYRILKKKMRESGLVYYNMKEKSKLNNLVYTVNPLPHALLNFVFDFASLQEKDEKKYITNTIISIISKIQREGLLKNINQNELSKLTDEIIDSIVICHKFIRQKYDESSVSLREIRRFGIFFEYFIKYFNDTSYKKMKYSLNMTLYLCYYLRLNDKEYRKQLAEKLKKYYKGSNFLKTPENEIRKLTGEMSVEKGKGIALNRALRENLFTCFTCIDNKVPLIIVGKPGTGKSLSFQILYNTLKGEYSESEIFKKKGKLYRYYYQGSETSTAKGIKQVFKKASNAQMKNKDRNFITLVFFDEMGLAERSSNNPLKVIHYLLEKDSDNSVPFLGISNWRLDASKINRALNLSITDYDIQDLEETAISIAQALDNELSNNYQDFFEILARTYYEFVQFNENTIQENKNFHGNRDFYNLIKIAMRELIKKRNELPRNEKRILSEIGLLSLNRNFGGLENSNENIKQIFIKLYGHKFDKNVNFDKNFSILDAIKKNIMDSNSRYLMLISEGNDGSDIIKYLLNSLNKRFIDLVGSKYKADIKSGRYSEEILNKIKYIMESDNVLILRDLDMIYASLYDLFNQNFTIMGDKKFARIAFEYAKISSEVNNDFHVIVIVNKTKIKQLKLDPPFLNRFEKHIVTFNMLLKEKDIEIAKKITEFIDLISSFNNNNKLKIDLEKLLINCKQHNIEGLIFKIKNDRKNKNEELNANSPEYEDNIIKEVFKKIVPTFCQDIIASMITSNIEQKYNRIKEIILEIYKKSNYNNFESFFKKIESRKNIIYTFSKSTENLFEEETQNIKNKFGTFNKQSTTIEMIDTPKSENELAYLLKSFNNSKNKKLLIFKVTENNTNKINSVNYVINNFEKEYPKLKEKLILFVVHKQRMAKNIKEDKTKKTVTPDLISFINDEYYQIFIDNLQGKENSNVLKLIEKKNEELAKEYIDNSNFVENRIFTVLNYIKYTILFETKELNIKNITKKISEKIIKNQTVKQLIMNNLKMQGKAIKGVIKDVFITDIIDVNDVDFFEVINSKLSSYFCSYLLNIIFHSLKENVLNQILFNPDLDSLMHNEYFNNLIDNIFNKIKFNFVPKLKMNVNANKITIYNGLELPKSKSYLEIIIKYVDEDIAPKYLEQEGNIRTKVIKQEKEQETLQEFNKKVERYEENVRVEINKQEYLKAIYNENNIQLKKMILNDYLKYFIIKYIEKKEVNYKINESLLSFLKFIIKIKFSERKNQHYDFENTIEEFAKIIIFVQEYKEDINSIFDIFIDIQKYCKNIEELMGNILDDEIIEYEISERNKKYTKNINISLFNLIESLMRAILSYSIELINKDKVKFFEYFYYLTTVEATLQKINKKYLLFSKEIYNIRYIIKIEEAYKSNHEQFENNFVNIMNNLLQQSILLYKGNYNQLYNSIMDLIKIFDDTFENKNEEYINLLFFIFRQQYKNIYQEEIRIQLVENFLKNKLLVKKSKIFLSETLKDLKPEVFNEKSKKKENSEESLVKNFMDLENKKMEKYKNIINICNNIDSPEFNEILLFFFESQCQSYFLTILKKYKNKYTEACCEKLLLKVSLSYFKKAVQYLYENKNKKNNNFLKLYAIAYVKTYSYFYVEINFAHFDKCKWEEINRFLNDKDANNENIRNMRNIYIWRLFCKKFDNFEKFLTFERNIPILKEFEEKIKKENNNVKYIFKESFITPSIVQNYKNLSLEIENKFIKNQREIKLNYAEINNNFDLYYSILVNKIISYTYGNEKNKFINIMKNIYEESYKEIKMGEEGKKLYNYLLNDALFQREIVNKISEKPLTQDEFEILLYSLRFIFNTQINNNNCFYNEILKKNASAFINNNFIPGSFPLINEYLKSYNILDEKLKQKLNMGYYICKDCGFLYEVKPCTYPMITDKCPNGHVIGGHDHVCSKKDIRVFYEQADINNFTKYWHSYPNWYNSFVSTTLKDFKTNYVDKNIIKPQKGIIKDFEINEFEKKTPVRDINIITFRILNFILYSYLIGSYILNNLSKEEANNYLVENLFPHTLFGIIKKNWEFLSIYLKENGIENIQIFINMIFEKIIKLINNLKSVDTVEKLYAFEKEVDKYIMDIISKKENIEKINKEYQEMNNELLSFDPQSIKEIVLANYEPSIYNQDIYPDIQYYSISNILDYNTFVNKFESLKENEIKYSLINMLIKKDEDLTQDAIRMKSLENINKITNVLLNIYSFKISREDGKEKNLKKELGYIIDTYNEMNPIKINNEEEFINDYVNPFIESWDLVKKQSIQYKCRILRELDKGEKPLEMTIDNKLCYFLVDDGDKEGGMFLASAYSHFIEWQNAFIDLIISKNNMNGILSSYVPLLEQEIDVQEANKEDIINIDDKTFKNLEDLIYHSSMRNIFTSDNKINYKNYNNITYNYEYIEEELGKIILPGIKKFKPNKIKFITYLFEGFRGDNSSILIDYNTKYPPKKLNDDEKEALNDLLKNNNNSKFYNDIFASLQILMNEIVKENYKQDHLIDDIINGLPPYIILNPELVKLFKDAHEMFMDEKVFTINSLVSIFEYFEALCWKEIKNNILPDYQIELSEENKQYMTYYFEKNYKEENIINKKNLTDALRKLISRSIAGSRQEIEIKPEAQLKLYIGKYELWGQEIVEDESFQKESIILFKDDILICHCWNLYNLLGGDYLLDKEINKNKEEKQKQEEIKNDENEINTKSNQNEEEVKNNNKEKKNKDDEDDEEENEEEERELE